MRWALAGREQERRCPGNLRLAGCRQISGARAPSVEAGDLADEAVRARQRLGLSQDTFAALLGVSSGTLRGWEQGRRQPTRAARVLLRVAAQHPEAVLAAAKIVA
ncbi:MAG: helix-turn-helix domain-containing protein [Terrimicrobiaceae bacterium]